MSGRSLPPRASQRLALEFIQPARVGPGAMPTSLSREVRSDRRKRDPVPRCPSVGSDFWKISWLLQGGIGQLKEDRASDESVAEVTPELGERRRDEDGTVTSPDVRVGVTGMTMSEPA